MADLFRKDGRLSAEALRQVSREAQASQSGWPGHGLIFYQSLSGSVVATEDQAIPSGSDFAEQLAGFYYNGVTVANTITETSLFTGNPNILGSQTLPVFLSAGQNIRVHASGSLSTGGSPGTLAFNIKAAGVAVDSVTISPAAATSGATWILDATIVKGGTDWGDMEVRGMFGGAGAFAAVVGSGVDVIGHLPGATLDLTVQWSVASSSNTITINSGLIEFLF